jgi:hypothetical protein
LHMAGSMGNGPSKAKVAREVRDGPCLYGRDFDRCLRGLFKAAGRQAELHANMEVTPRRWELRELPGVRSDSSMQ